MKPRALDLFCGAAGGWSLGLHRAGFETVAACEIDPWRRIAFLRNFPDVVMYDDIRNLTAERLRADGAFPDIIVGSPPCQDASIARREKRTGIDGDRTGLFREYLRLVREVRPNWCCAENVIGLRGVGDDVIVRDLVESGFTVWCFDMGAEDFGATHERRRLWFIAVADAHKARLEDARRQYGEAGPHRLGAAVGSGQVARNPWQQGEGDFVRLADGLPNDVAYTRVVGAFGDAVVPQITEALGLAILAAEAA